MENSNFTVVLIKIIGQKRRSPHVRTSIILFLIFNKKKDHIDNKTMMDIRYEKYTCNSHEPTFIYTLLLNQNDKCV